jgi:polar amino acid transport system substrate-binding protein
MPYELIEVEKPAAVLEKLKSGDGDVTGVPISQLSELEDEYDYTYGIYETGAQIVASTEISAPRSLRTLLQATYLLELLGVAFLVLIVIAHAIWLIERKRPDSNFRPGYLHGIYDAFWWACVTATTVGYGDAVPRGALGRALALLWMFGALFLVTLFIGNITAAVTVGHLDRGIQTVEDLRGHEVGALAANPILERIRLRGVDPILYETPGELFDAMTAGKLDAIVHEWAMGSYYVRHDGKGRTFLAGPRFTRTKAALLLPEESPYREVLDRAILRIFENGLYDQIHARWFHEITGGSEN